MIDACGGSRTWRSPVTLNFSGTPASEVVLDGDLEPAGRSYAIDGTGNLHVVNQTVGLSVTINGYRDQDELRLRLPGAIVAAECGDRRGRERSVRRKRAAPSAPIRPHPMTSLSWFDPVRFRSTRRARTIRASTANKVYVLASLPQDSLTVTAPTTFKSSPTQQGQSPVSYGSGFNTYFAVCSSAAFSGDFKRLRDDQRPRRDTNPH